MNVKIKEFISTNKNTGVTWNIDGQMFTGNNFIPSHLLEKYVIDWTVNQWRGIIIITTECNKQKQSFMEENMSENKNDVLWCNIYKRKENTY